MLHGRGTDLITPKLVPFPQGPAPATLVRGFFRIVKSIMRTITGAIMGFGFLLTTEPHATDPHCVRPEQPPGTGNSMLTWRIPDDCPLTEGERETKERCQIKLEGARPRVCWGYDLY
jgi:hypothetical protein